MATRVASTIAIVAIAVAVIGIFFLGAIALLLAIVLLGFAVFALEGELETGFSPPVAEPPHPMRYACPGCGGDVYAGQATCPACGTKLPAVGSGPAATPP